MFKYFISTLVFTISILAHGQQASFPSAEDIQQSWKKMQTAQQAQVTPRYGTQRAVYAKVKLNKRFFDSDLLDLNIRASSVWDTLVGCHGEQASATYFTGNPCPQAKAELKELAKNIRQYLSSAYLDSFHSYDLECNQGEGCNYLLREQKEIVSRRFSAEAVQTILELEKQLEVPLLHPLFVQIVMDITTEGFPFQFVKKICTGFFCRSAYYMLDSNALSNTALYEHIEENLGYDPSQLTYGSIYILYSGKKSDVEQLINILVPYYRRAILGLEILGINSLGQGPCQRWGLDPQQNYETVLMMESAQSGHSNLKQIRQSMSRSCGFQREPPRSLSFFSMDDPLANQAYNFQNQLLARLTKLQEYWK